MPGGGIPARWSWRCEVLLLVLLYGSFEVVRVFVAGSLTMARWNAGRLLEAERDLHLAVERGLNGYVTAHPLLAVPACFAYASLHNVVTLGVLVWLWHCHPQGYAASRTGLIIATALGLIGFILLPMAPPRLLPGFTDTMRAYGSYGWWGATARSGAGEWTNQVAAMPSLHVGWAVWAGWAVWRNARSPYARGLAVAYPLFVIWVVVGTANHYVLDAVAGLAVISAGLLCGSRIHRTRPVQPVGR